MKRRDVIKLAGTFGSLALLPGMTAAENIALNSAPALLPGIIPTLPQNQSLLDKIARQGGLAVQQATYQWTECTPNLIGIPTVVGFPLDELPTIEWLIKAVLTLIDVIVNVLASLVVLFGQGLASSLAALQSQLDDIKSNVASAEAAYARLLAANMGKTQLSAAAAAQAAQLQQSLYSSLTQLGAFKDKLLPLVQWGLANNEGAIADKDLSMYDAMFQTIPRPAIADQLHDDAIFAYLRVAGPNPMLIKRVNALPAKFPLSDAQYRQVMGPGDSLSAAAASNRLYLLDYVDLGGLASSGGTTTKLLTGIGYDCTPMALFALPQGGTSLTPVAIQCGQDPSTAPIFLPAKPTDEAAYWSWQMAKTAVQTADFNYHEMFVHLSRTHLITEAFCIATHRHLSTDHPLNVLLRPHFEGDLFINLIAVVLIMSPITFGDMILSAPIESIQQAVRNDRLNFDFYAMMPPNDFKARGVDNIDALADYPYRDDALLVWNAIAQWVRDYLAVYYTSDHDVRADTELSAWSWELIRVGKIKGFKPITSLGQLVDVVSMIIFTAGAQHAAVNYPQSAISMSPTLFPGNDGAPAPNGATKGTKSDWIKMFPTVLGALVQVNFLYLLGSIYYRPLGDYRANAFPYRPVLTDPRIVSSGGPLERFQAALQNVETVIQGRNKQRSWPYPFLLPSKIPTSTNI